MNYCASENAKLAQCMKRANRVAGGRQRSLPSARPGSRPRRGRPAPRRWSHLPDQQRRRTRAKRHRRGKARLVVRGLRSRRGAGRGDLHPDRDGQAQRRRSASLARRRSPPDRRPPRQPPRRPTALELATDHHRGRSGVNPRPPPDGYNLRLLTPHQPPFAARLR